MSLSDEQEYALELFNEGKNLLITGPGGVGKTHLIHTFIEHAEKNKKVVQVCALTGCASLLLGCNAKTIHSWSGIKMARGERKQIVENAMRGRKTKSNWKGVDILIIDEVSMMSKKIFETLAELAQVARHNPSFFGGLQIVFAGDFLQLPPIGSAKEPDTSAFCFESPMWFDIIPLDNHIELNTMFRQKDPVYIEILSQIRKGKLSIENTELLNEHSLRKYDPSEHDGMYLTQFFPIKARVEYINAVMFDKIETETVKYDIEMKYQCLIYLESGIEISAKIVAKCDRLSANERDYEMNSLLTNSQCSQELSLKVGALVMCTANIDLDNGVCNGSQGVIIEFVGSDKLPKVRFANGHIMTMTRHSWQSSDFPKIAVRQYPLQLAWALTVHKIQGATLDRAEMDVGTSVFEYGQTYVAMSRVKSLEGLYLSDFNATKIKANPKVLKFYQKIPQIEYVDDEGN